MFHAETTFLALPSFFFLLFSFPLFSSLPSSLSFTCTVYSFLISLYLTFDLPHLSPLSFFLPFSLAFHAPYFTSLLLQIDTHTFRNRFKSSATDTHKTLTILTYTAPVWSSTCSSNYLRLQVIQSKCLRVIGNHPRRTPLPTCTTL